MNEFCDVIWRFFKDQGVSWVGFYELDLDEATDKKQMILGPSRDKLACSPIEMRGACGMSCEKKRPIIVNDVHNLGEHYIACDPKDRSEIIIPLFNSDGSCYGVLDIDSFDRDAFGEHDMIELRKLMESTAISWPTPHRPALVY
jgi:putative methionine-R-sulfoxide reductase with GAF domain